MANNSLFNEEIFLRNENVHATNKINSTFAFDISSAELLALRCCESESALPGYPTFGAAKSFRGKHRSPNISSPTSL